jgi:hypothetical protein
MTELKEFTIPTIIIFVSMFPIVTVHFLYLVTIQVLQKCGFKWFVCKDCNKKHHTTPQQLTRKSTSADCGMCKHDHSQHCHGGCIKKVEYSQLVQKEKCIQTSMNNMFGMYYQMEDSMVNIPTGETYTVREWRETTCGCKRCHCVVCGGSYQDTCYNCKCDYCTSGGYDIVKCLGKLEIFLIVFYFLLFDYALIAIILNNVLQVHNVMVYVFTSIHLLLLPALTVSWIPHACFFCA